MTTELYHLTPDRHRRIGVILDHILTDIEAEDDPAFTPEQIDCLEKRFSELRELLPHAEAPDIDYFVHSILAGQRKIAAIWCSDDVRNSRPDLTDQQAWEVLEQVRDIHDAEWGISWTTLQTVADDMFPEPDEPGQTARQSERKAHETRNPPLHRRHWLPSR